MNEVLNIINAKTSCNAVLSSSINLLRLKL